MRCASVSTGRPLPELFSDVHRVEKALIAHSGDLYLESAAAGIGCPAPLAASRTAASRDAGGYDAELFYEDFDLLLRLARDHSIDAIEAPLVRFREVGASLGHTEFSFSNLRFLRAMVRIYQKNIGVNAGSDAVAVPKLRYWDTQAVVRGCPGSPRSCRSSGVSIGRPRGRRRRSGSGWSEPACRGERCTGSRRSRSGRTREHSACSARDRGSPWADRVILHSRHAARALHLRWVIGTRSSAGRQARRHG